jgi:hypothetical protein
MGRVAPFTLQGKVLQFRLASTFVPVLQVVVSIALSSVFILFISLLVRCPFL